MKRAHIKFLPLVAGLLITTVSTGCATNAKVVEVRAEAREAQHTADRALSLAQEANNRSIQTEEMLNRSFKHGLRK